MSKYLSRGTCNRYSLALARVDIKIQSSIGARFRYQIDRDSDAYKQVYQQRTAIERINSQAVALGIERPKLRNAAAIANRNTLIYALIDLRALHRVRRKLRDAALRRRQIPRRDNSPA